MEENNKPQNVSAADAKGLNGSMDTAPARDTPRRFTFRTQEPKAGASKKKKGLLLVLISIAILLGALALFYVYWFQNPNKVVADGLSHAFSAESLTYTGAVTTVGATKTNVALNGGVSPDGGTVNAAFTFDTKDKKYSLEGSGLVDARSDLYLKVKNIDELVANYRSSVPVDSQPLFDQIVAKINDKWVKVSAKDIEEFNPELAAAQECTVDAYKKLQSDKAVKTELMAAYEKNPFIAVDKTLGAKDGSLGYMLTTNNDAFKSFVKDYKNTSLYKSLRECDSSFTVNENEGLKTKDDAKVEVWINRWSHQITRVVMRDEQGRSTTNVSIEPKFNRSVPVNTPKDATTVEQLQKDINSLLQTPQ